MAERSRIIRGIAAAVGAAIAVVCVRYLPELWADKAGEQAAREAVAPVARRAATQAADDAVRRTVADVARREAAKFAAGLDGGGSRLQPSASVGTTQPVATSATPLPAAWHSRPTTRPPSLTRCPSQTGAGQALPLRE